MEKQYLISPPASPPVGWEPVHEGEPVIDLRLIAALAALQPGEHFFVISNVRSFVAGEEEKLFIVS